ncbi:uncharacterized protein LOC141632856 [Silene latifolia]|uniref:uncharacterized protein LOC141632856 n=1 Tax=Silene latifolia TaxID=37657 RepID=UPI003D784F47
MGDFNVVRYPIEKISSHLPIASEMMDFNSCFLSCDLEEMADSGHDFTLFNKQEPSTRVYSKYDRALVNSTWTSHFDQTSFNLFLLASLNTALLWSLFVVITCLKRNSSFLIVGLIILALSSLFLKPGLVEGSLETLCQGVDGITRKGKTEVDDAFVEHYQQLLGCSAVDIVEHNFCVDVEDLFRKRFLPKQANVTVISLIPKKPVVQTAESSYAKLVGEKHTAFLQDDLMVFTRRDLPSVQKATEILDMFAGWSGLRANLDKTEAYFGGVSPDVKQLILSSYCRPKGRCSVTTLSYAGKLQIIHSVIFGFRNFWCSSLFLPRHICKTITKLSKGLFWGCMDGHQRLVFKSWENICSPKTEGGFQIKNFSSWNRAVLLKLIWQLDQDQGTIFTHWIQSYHLADYSIWEVSSKEHFLESFRGILQVRDAYVQQLDNK